MVTKYVMGILFLFAAFSKLQAISQFEMTILEQKLIENRQVAAYITRFLIAVEFALGCCFFQRRAMKRIILPVSIGITFFFTGYLIYTMLIGYEENCGCFGNLLPMTPIQSIGKNVLILGILGYLWKVISRDHGGTIIPGMIFLISIVAVFFFFPVRLINKSTIVNKKNVDSQSSRFSVFDKILAEKGYAQITKGDCLVAFLSLDCDHCKDVAFELGMLQKNDSIRIFCVFWGEADSIPDFFAEVEAQFENILLPSSSFFDFIGNAPPRVYWLQDGYIRDFWDKETFSLATIEQSIKNDSR